jgi:hypothetical protein
MEEIAEAQGNEKKWYTTCYELIDEHCNYFQHSCTSKPISLTIQNHFRLGDLLLTSIPSAYLEHSVKNQRHLTICYLNLRMKRELNTDYTDAIFTEIQ